MESTPRLIITKHRESNAQIGFSEREIVLTAGFLEAGVRQIEKELKEASDQYRASHQGTVDREMIKAAREVKRKLLLVIGAEQAEVQ